MRDVVLDALQRTAEEAGRAAAEEPDPFRALARYMHRAIDVRAAAVIPALLGEISLDDEEIMRARDISPATIEALIDAAHQAGALRRDVTSGDIGMFIVRLRPLPGGFPRQTNDSLSHRHLDLLIDGLRPTLPAARPDRRPGHDLRGPAPPPPARPRCH
jgi:hypothetical protein